MTSKGASTQQQTPASAQLPVLEERHQEVVQERHQELEQRITQQERVTLPTFCIFLRGDNFYLLAGTMYGTLYFTLTRWALHRTSGARLVDLCAWIFKTF